MARAKSREAKINRAISVAQYLAEGGHTVEDAKNEFDVNGTTIKRDLDYLKSCILSRTFSTKPQKEKQLIIWYNTARTNLMHNHNTRKNNNT